MNRATAGLSSRDRGRGLVVGGLVGAGCCTAFLKAWRRNPCGALKDGGRRLVVQVDAGGGDRLALAVLAQYRMATTGQVHVLVAPGVRIEQTRRRLVKLRAEGLIERITLPQAGRMRVWYPTAFGVQVASEWPELRGRRPPRLASDSTAARLRAGHTLAVTETGLAFVQDARRLGDTCHPLDWIPEVHHSLGAGEAVIPDALLYYRHGKRGRGSMLRAFVEIDRATMGPERLAAKIGAYARLHDYVPAPPVGRRPAPGEPAPMEGWRHHYPLFPRLLFVLDHVGPRGIETRIDALHAAAGNPALTTFLHTVPVLAAPLTDILHSGPSEPVWRPVHTPNQRVPWTTSAANLTVQ
ncbi:replication-relaxation family protein [Streptomyces sp. NPDC048002]|uniref:replication-relaxation family protein n=1 Tax=Streptomyces sp. NPDC048002 TaxID=3154344 RepID=UPI00340F7F02